MNNLELRKITLGDRVAFEKADSLFPKENHFEFVPLVFRGSGQGFESLLECFKSFEVGRDLPEGHVASTMLFAFNFEGEIVGRVSVRHALNDYLLQFGGHIGYGVLPKFRNLGYATRILRETLIFCQNQLNLPRVLLTCNTDNQGSIRTIEKNGGILESVVSSPSRSVPTRRYWIDLQVSS